MNNALRLINNHFKTLILYFSLLFSSCQSEQIQWIEELNDNRKESNHLAYPSELDKRIAYIHKYPKDTLRNFTILKKSIIESINVKNEDLTYKLILLGLQKYPSIILEKEFYDAISDFYLHILREENTIKWMSGIVLEKWNEDQKTAFFMTLFHNIKEEIDKSKSYKKGEEIVNMAKIHSLLFPDLEQSAYFLWKSYEILRWMESDFAAIKILDLILVRHKSWADIKKVKKERGILIRNKNRLIWINKDKINLDTSKKYQAPVS
jgi:hypothetical protein